MPLREYIDWHLLCICEICGVMRRTKVGFSVLSVLVCYDCKAREYTHCECVNVRNMNAGT